MTLTQTQADRLIAMLKKAARTEAFVWERNQRQDELVIAVDDQKVQFILSLKRSPFEIRLHLRARDRDIGLVRLDHAYYHSNPDGTEIRNRPHLHSYREGGDLDWAEEVDGYDLTNPLGTLERFLREIHTRFPAGFSLDMF